MFTFVKVAIPHHDEQDGECIMLKIANQNELMEYMKFFAGRAWAGSNLCISRLQKIGEISHLGQEPEAILLKIMAESKAEVNGSYKFSPMELVPDLIAQKWELMSDILLDGNTILVNEKGGLCPMADFLKIHSATIAEELVSEKLVFPKKIDMSKTYHTVILENDNELDYDWTKITMAERGNWLYHNQYKIIDKLKMRQQEEILFYVKNATEIITKTTFLNEEQTIGFIKLFSIFTGKTIRIISGSSKTTIDELSTKESLKSLIDKVFKNNTVVFYDTNLKVQE